MAVVTVGEVTGLTHRNSSKLISYEVRRNEMFKLD